MENLDFNILKEDELLDILSMDDVKGGLMSDSDACCGSKSIYIITKIKLNSYHLRMIKKIYA